MTFHKYPKIIGIGEEENKELLSTLDDEIIVEEKIDGANFRFLCKDGRIIFGSRTQSIGDDTQEIGGNWKRCVVYIKEKIDNPLAHEGLIFYGENCVKHSIHYDFSKMPPYLGFDIMDLQTGKFLDYNAKKLCFESMGLTLVPLIKIVKAGEITPMKDPDIPKSAYYEGQCEGLVFKNYSKQVMGKYVTQHFKEVNRDTFGKGKKFAENDSERIVAMYCTNARIDKMVFKLLDEGEKLSIELMHKLPNRVLEDIYEENWKEICHSTWSVHFREVRKMVSHRCLMVLKQLIVNNIINGGK